MQDLNYLSTRSDCEAYMLQLCVVSDARGSLLRVEETPFYQDIVTYYVCMCVSAAPPPLFCSIL